MFKTYIRLNINTREHDKHIIINVNNLFTFYTRARIPGRGSKALFPGHCFAFLILSLTLSYWKNLYRHT